MSEKTKNQLHQLLAVENGRKQQAVNIMNETINTFQKKTDHFDGLTKIYSAFEEGGQEVPPETKEVKETVPSKINYAKKSIIKAIDAQLSKEESNASGIVRAELLVKGVSFGELSSTSLLALESHMLKVRAVYKAIPTLDPVRKWNKDEFGIYITDSEVKYKTSKKQQVITLYEATKEHPAQVQLDYVDTQVGQYDTTYKSGKITPKQKSDLLAKIDNIIDAVKRARAKANQAEIVEMKIGNKLFDYINKDILG
jgi:hypothetical protein